MIAPRHDASTLAFRTPNSSQELLALLRLRYRIYGDCRMRVFSPKTVDEINVDAWDRTSHHFGVYRGGPGGEPVGYARLVTGEKTATGAILRELQAQSPSVRSALATSPDKPLPFLTYFPGVDEIEKLHVGWSDQGQGYVEPSRLVLSSQERSSRTGTFLTSSIAAFWFVAGLDRAIVACQSDHVRRYSRMGFRIARGTEPSVIEGNPVTHCLELERAWLSDRARSSIEALADQWAREGHITLNERVRPKRPTLPSPVPSPLAIDSPLPVSTQA